MQTDLRPFGFNLIGHVSANAGLGVTARNIAKIILDRGYPLAILDIDPGHGRSGHDLLLEPYFVKTARELPFGINISTLSITSLPDFIFDFPELFTEETLNVGYFWWELSTLPEHWIKSLENFDVLLAGSDFLYSSYSQAVENAFHVRIVHAVDLPPEIKSDRDKFDIENDAYVFICILEPTSDPVRKNPFSVITAFQQAFTANEKVRLIIKINNAAAFATDDENLQLLRDAAETDQRIRLFTTALTYVDALTLYASCDVYVALHRAEGLGLGLMEAMLLGKPVIATSWSGNMSFMDHTNSCLVRYKLVPVAGSLSVYKTEFLGNAANWAEPNIDDATGWMKVLFSQPDLYHQIGTAAKLTMSQYLNHEATSKWLDEIQLIWKNSKITPPLSSAVKFPKKAFLRRYQATRNMSQWGKIRHHLSGLLDRHLLWRFKKNRNGAASRSK